MKARLKLRLLKVQMDFWKPAMKPAEVVGYCPLLSKQQQWQQLIHSTICFVDRAWMVAVQLNNNFHEHWIPGEDLNNIGKYFIAHLLH